MSQKWKYAALSEAVYRRDHRDQAIDIDDLAGAVTGLDTGVLGTVGLSVDATAPGYIYDPTNGFAAYVVNMDGKTVIAFRGTDFDIGWIGDAFSPQYVDSGDVSSNLALGRGSYDIDPSEGARTQWQSAKALVEYLTNDLGIADSSIVVTGHSLGGGLAGLTAMKYGFDNYLFGPAPFMNQMEKEADQVATEYVLNLHADKFRDGFHNKWIGDQADSLAIGLLEGHEGAQMLANVKILHYLSIPQILSDFSAKKNEVLQQYEARALTLDITSVKGEFTSNHAGYGSILGLALDLGAKDFRPEGSYDDNTDIGLQIEPGGEALARHSPSLNALIEKSQDGSLVSTGSFDDLMAENQQVRHVLLNGGGIAGANKHPKVGPSDDMSATGDPDSSGAATVELFYRTLWKSIGSQDGLYDYMEQMFSDVIVNGMAANGLGDDPTAKLENGADANLNRGITHLAMGVFRDAIQGTSNNSEVLSNLGGAAEFLGALDAGYIHVPAHLITSQREVHLDPIGDQKFGARDVELFTASYLNSFTRAKEWLLIEDAVDAVRNDGTSLFGWGHLFVHAGAESQGLTIDLNAVPESDLGSLIITMLEDQGNSSFDDFILTGAGSDWILLGDGNDRVNAGDGNNVIVHEGSTAEGETEAAAAVVHTGAGNDVILTGEGNDIIVSGLGLDRIDSGAGDDYIETVGAGTIIHSGAGNDVIIASGIGTQIFSGAGVDTILVNSQAALLADASVDDQIVFGTRILNGALAWGDASEKEFLTDRSDGVRYGKNADGELVIQSLGGNQMLFVAGYDDDEMTAGIRLRGVSWSAYQILDPDYPGGEAYIQGISDMMDEVYFALNGVERTATDPLILDLDGDGIELAGMSSISPFYDLDGDGFAERTGWTTGDDGFLAIDLNQDGQINDITELFGDRDTSGFDALAVHDLNADGVIDANDAVFADLRIWHDINSNGVTDTGELDTLSDHGIASINITPANQTLINMTGNEIAAEGSYTLSDGTTQSIFDVRLRTDELNSQYLGDTTVSAAVAALPDAKGYGELPSLHIAATQDANVLSELQIAQTSLDSHILSDLFSSVRPLTNA